MKTCILYERSCTGCGECRCELDPNKVCDNCFACLSAGEDRPYAEIPVSRICLTEEEYAAEIGRAYSRLRCKTLPGCSGARFF